MSLLMRAEEEFTESVLRIRQIKRPDFGTYTCRVHNHKGTVEATATLSGTHQRLPSFLPGKTDPASGFTFELHEYPSCCHQSVSWWSWTTKRGGI